MDTEQPAVARVRVEPFQVVGLRRKLLQTLVDIEKSRLPAHRIASAWLLLRESKRAPLRQVFGGVQVVDHGHLLLRRVELTGSSFSREGPAVALSPVPGPTGNGSKATDMTRSRSRQRMSGICAFRTAEELERCSELLYNQRARPVPRQQRAAALGAPSLPPVRASMDYLIKVTVYARHFRTDGPRHNSSGL